MDLKKELNEKQYEAAAHNKGPLLILAGAGSGKTRVLTYRIANLIENCGVSPSNILAITFTNKAAKEMVGRISFLMGENTRGMWVHTFHAACGRILRSNAELLGFSSNFVVYDESEALIVVKDSMKKLNINDKIYQPKIVRVIISKAKDEMLTPEKYMNVYGSSDFNSEKYAKIYEMYQETLKKNNAMDFDDMILMTIKLFKEHPEVLEYYQDRFKYILVDEYQDTNKAQYELVYMLAAKYRNLCVVGDDDQSIYGFRGADVRNILDFEKDYPECKVIKLEQNYRSTQNILEAANHVISHNTNRKGKTLWTAQNGGDLVERFVAADQNEEGYYISKQIKKGFESGKYKYSDFAVLYRLNALSQSCESSLVRMNIPYKIYGGLKFFDRKEVKDLVSYLRVIENLKDDVALKRIINVPKRGIGETTVGYAEEIAIREKCPLFNIMVNACNYPELSRVSSKMEAFSYGIADQMLKKDDMGISDFVKCVLDQSGMIEEYQKENTPESQVRIQNLMEFLSVAKQYENDQKELQDGDNTFSGFIQSIVLSSDLDGQNANDDCVTLMTIHNAKGLEFPVVFVIGMEEELFPSMRAISESETGIDEERRLCYVAITRAKSKLYLINASSRMLYGQTSYNPASRFLSEIPINLLSGLEQRRSRISNSRLESTSAPEKSFEPKINAYADIFKRTVNNIDDINKAVKHKDSGLQESSINLKVGMRVMHKKFGEGTISLLNGSGLDQKIEIMFDDVGMKRLMAAYANLSEINS